MLTLIILAAMERILRTEARARQKAEQLQLTLENMSQGIMLVTKDLQIPIINGRCGELLDLPADVHRAPAAVRSSSSNSRPRSANSAMPRHRRRQLPIEACRTQVTASGQFAISERKMPNGTVIEVRSAHLPDGSFVQTFTDITKRCEAEAHVARLASEDPLTGLPNRRVFRSTLDQLSRQIAPRTGDAASERNLPSCSSISIVSRSSTTRSAIASATCFCRKWQID